MSEPYVIIDLDGYVYDMRAAAAKSIAPDSNENLDDYISLNQMKNLVNEFSLGYDDEDQVIIDEEGNLSVFENATTWITNVGLAKLAAAGELECAWDSNINSMIFWYAERKSNEREHKITDQGLKGKD
jgi:hypothetical protein